VHVLNPDRPFLLQLPPETSMPPDHAPALVAKIATRGTAILGHAADLARRALGTAGALEAGSMAADLAGQVQIPAGPGLPDLAGQVQPAPAAPTGVASATILETIRQAVAEALAETERGPSSSKRQVGGDEWRQLLEQLLVEISAKRGPAAADDYRRLATPADVLDELARHHLHERCSTKTYRRTARKAVSRAMDRLGWGQQAERDHEPVDSLVRDEDRSAVAHFARDDGASITRLSRPKERPVSSIRCSKAGCVNPAKHGHRQCPQCIAGEPILNRRLSAIEADAVDRFYRENPDTSEDLETAWKLDKAGDDFE
jgi:hypothetical protein